MSPRDHNEVLTINWLNVILWYLNMITSHFTWELGQLRKREILWQSPNQKSNPHVAASHLWVSRRKYTRGGVF